MSEGHPGPFREKSLERLSSPERLDQLLRVVDRKSWLPLATLAVLVTLLVLWSVIGTIPENVEGKGILVRPREIVELQSPSAGYLRELYVEVGDEVAPGDVLAVIARPEIDKQLELQQAKLRELTAQLQGGQLLRVRDRRMRELLPGVPADGDDLAAFRAIADRLRDKELQAIAEERRRTEQQLAVARAHERSLDSRRAGQRELHESGIISRAELDEIESDYMDVLARVAALDSDLDSLRSRELEVEEDYLERLQHIAGREQELAEVNREIARLEQQLEQQSRITSEQAGRVLELSAAAGEFIPQGARVGSMAINDPAATLVSVTYFTVRDGKRLEPEQEIRVTPATVERQRFGSIRGTIRKISPFPVTLAEAERIIGNPELAASLVGGGYVIQVYAELHRDPETASGFAWTSSRGPQLGFSAGTTTTARVAVEQRAPISFVLPFLRSSAGID